VAVPEVRVVNEGDRLRVLMNFITLLANRKGVPLLLAELQNQVLQLDDVEITNMKEVSGEVHGFTIGPGQSGGRSVTAAA
jgi:hypothetical protein